MTREQHIAKAENIIHAALNQIEQAAENAAEIRNAYKSAFVTLTVKKGA